MQETTANGLPRIVGYSEVASALGVQRRTIERMVRGRTFPAPIQLSSNRVGWRADVVIDWLQERQARVLAVSIEDPSGIEPQQLADGAARLGAAVLSRVSGQPVRPEDVCLSRVATLAEREVILKAQWDNRHDLVKFFDGLDILEALVVAHGLFPSLHILTEDIARRAGTKFPKDRKTAIDWALSVLLAPPEVRKKMRAERGCANL